MSSSAQISNRTMQLLRANALGGFKQTGTQLPNDWWIVPIADDIAERLSETRFEGESSDDLLQRILAGPQH